jgi:predicted metal-binding membrane protein
MWLRVRNDRLFVALLAAVIGLAWLGLWVWGQSPYGRFLSHQALTEVSSEDAALLVFFVAGWTVMIFAMMLPTSLPLITLFRAMLRGRPDGGRLVVLLIAGYVAVWAVFGAVVHLGDLAVHEAVEQVGWLDRNDWIIGASTLMLAGLYQFTPLKYQCLDKCRSPMSFIAGHWSGGNETVQSLRLGLDHGLFCLGCCWSLMLLMFGVGTGNIGWMLVLGAVMSVEKNMPWGRRISLPLGVGLIGWGIAEALRFALVS